MRRCSTPGKILLVAGSGNCPASLAGCPQGAQYAQGAALLDLSSKNINVMPTTWDMFCNGMSIMPDGRVLINGGTKAYGSLAVVGVKEEFRLPVCPTLRFSIRHGVVRGCGSDGAWTLVSHHDRTERRPHDDHRRTQRHRRRLQQHHRNLGWHSSGVRKFPGIPISRTSRDSRFPLYPRMHLLPTGHVFYSAPSSATLDFNPSTQIWTLVAWTIYPGENDPNGERTYGTSVLLPLTPQNNYSPKVIIMGGDNPATDTTELIDLSPAGFQISAGCPTFAPCWVQGPKMAQTRVEMEATILPNGKVLVDGGSAPMKTQARQACRRRFTIPRRNSFSSAGSNAFPRLYHNVQLLLPDATVAITGGNPAQGVFENHIEIYQPSYLFNSDGTLATRPTIGAARPVQSPTQATSSADSGRVHNRLRCPDESGLGHSLV